MGYPLPEHEQGQDHDVVRSGHLHECREGQVDRAHGVEEGSVREELENSEEYQEREVPEPYAEFGTFDDQKDREECDRREEESEGGHVERGDALVVVEETGEDPQESEEDRTCEGT